MGRQIGKEVRAHYPFIFMIGVSLLRAHFTTTLFFERRNPESVCADLEVPLRFAIIIKHLPMVVLLMLDSIWYLIPKTRSLEICSVYLLIITWWGRWMLCIFEIAKFLVFPRGNVASRRVSRRLRARTLDMRSRKSVHSQTVGSFQNQPEAAFAESPNVSRQPSKVENNSRKRFTVIQI